MLLFLVLSISVRLLSSNPCSEPDRVICDVRALMHDGELVAAKLQAETALETRRLTPEVAALLHLELSKVLDRIGLHQNTRPVAEALEAIERAEQLAGTAGSDVAAKALLQRASYFYRAEMAERVFANATRDALDAYEMFETSGDLHGQADAAHRLGLIHMQRDELDEARRRFDESLELDIQAGARPILRGDYERHVGFLHQLSGDAAAAVPYFERSLQARREGGLTDQSMFAAETLASALVDAGRAEDARPHALYALILAEKLDSPVGKSRIGLVLGRMYEALGDSDAALKAFEMTRRAAESVAYKSAADRAASAIERLQDGRD